MRTARFNHRNDPIDGPPLRGLLTAASPWLVVAVVALLALS